MLKFEAIAANGKKITIHASNIARAVDIADDRFNFQTVFVHQVEKGA